jgi:hypothetical protein
MLTVGDCLMFTIDHDTKSELRLLMTVINGSTFGAVDVRSTHHGYHYRITKEGLGKYPRKTRRALRALLGDDSNRLYFEELEMAHGIMDWEDTLFEAKCGRDGKWHFEEPVDNVLALPFWSTARAVKRPQLSRKQLNRRRR